MNDETHVLDLCDKVLGRKASRQYRFPFLRGDSGVCLPCDAYYPDLTLVVEYRERQHSESVKLFDRRATVSGCSRGEQRKLYDQRRRDVLPTHGIRVVELDYAMFAHDGRRRLKRTADDERIVRAQLVDRDDDPVFVSVPDPTKIPDELVPSFQNFIQTVCKTDEQRAQAQAYLDARDMALNEYLKSLLGDH